MKIPRCKSLSESSGPTNLLVCGGPSVGLTNLGRAFDETLVDVIAFEKQAKLGLR